MRLPTETLGGSHSPRITYTGYQNASVLLIGVERRIRPIFSKKLDNWSSTYAVLGPRLHGDAKGKVRPTRVSTRDRGKPRNPFSSYQWQLPQALFCAQKTVCRLLHLTGTSSPKHKPWISKELVVIHVLPSTGSTADGTDSHDHRVSYWFFASNWYQTECRGSQGYSLLKLILPALHLIW